MSIFNFYCYKDIYAEIDVDFEKDNKTNVVMMNMENIARSVSLANEK